MTIYIDKSLLQLTPMYVDVQNVRSLDLPLSFVLKYIYIYMDTDLEVHKLTSNIINNYALYYEVLDSPW